MTSPQRTWREDLAIIDRTMKAISSVRDPEELVSVYWDGVGELLPSGEFVTLSRRNVAAPEFLITRSSRFTENFNPWTQRDRLPRLSGGILGELAYANEPVVIQDLPSRLKRDDPGWFYLQGYESLFASPQYDHGEGLNVSALLFPPGTEVDVTRLPMLHWHVGLFGRATQNLVLRNQLDDAMALLDKELQAVGEIQRSLLPQKLPAIPGFDVAAYYLTSARAGGDYYDFFPLPDGRWGIFIADVSGHGTPAAVLMAITHAIAHAQPGTHTPPSSLLAYLNAQLARLYTRVGSFVTAFYAVLDPETRTLTYSAAGHNPPRLVRRGRVLSLDEAATIPLGILPESTFEQATVVLEPGDLLVLYTDGVTEAMAPARDGSRALFGTDRLDRLLVEHPEDDSTACIERIRIAVSEFSQRTPATDDRTVIAMRSTGT